MSRPRKDRGTLPEIEYHCALCPARFASVSDYLDHAESAHSLSRQALRNAPVVALLHVDHRDFLEWDVDSALDGRVVLTKVVRVGR